MIIETRNENDGIHEDRENNEDYGKRMNGIVRGEELSKILQRNRRS